MPTQEKKMKAILSLDGGGIRGILTGHILVALEEKLNTAYTAHCGQPPRRPLRIGEYFDLVAGTSTGGILTCILLMPSVDDPTYPRFSAKEALELYTTYGQSIFKPTFSGRLPFLKGLFGPKFEGASMENILKSYMGEQTLRDLLKPCLITAYDIQDRRALFFTSLDAQDKASADFPLWQVARSTSAAPTFFPPARARSRNELENNNVDGGLFANNPTMCAVIEGLKVFKEAEDAIVLPNNMYVVSIGTGIVKKRYPFKVALNWGILSWLEPLIDIMMSAAAETVDYQLRKLFKTIGCEEQYHRIMPDLYDASPELDDVRPENLENLKQAGIKCVQQYDEKLDAIAAVLVARKG